MNPTPFHPILSCGQALRFEQALLKDAAGEWAAMQRAGNALAIAMLEDWRELGGTGWRWDGRDGGCDAIGDARCCDAGAAADSIAAVRCCNAVTHSASDARCCDAGALAKTANRIGPRLLVLVGKGHNGGDALIAAAAVVRRFECVEVVLYRTCSPDELRPLCRRAWDALFALAAEHSGVALRDASDNPPAALFDNAAAPYVFCIDGLLGMQFRPPLRGKEAAVLAVVNAACRQIGLRAAVDMPSGLGDAGAFQADFTYATGIAKRPVFKSCNSVYVGRLRYLDIGFFAAAGTHEALATACEMTAQGCSASGLRANTAAGTHELATGRGTGGDGNTDERAIAAADAEHGSAVDANRLLADSGLPRVQVLTAGVLNPFHNWRSPFGDKRLYGHLFVLGGSAQMPGALLMNVQSALRSGAGLVTAFAPQSVAAVFAAQAPEAMWIPWPETDEGTLALEGQHLLATRLNRASALLMGSGMGRSAETLALLEDIARTCDVPLILDADALQPSVLAAAARHPRHGYLAAGSEPVAGSGSGPACDNGVGRGMAGQSFAGRGAAATRPVVITPHAGEFMRLCPQAPAPQKCFAGAMQSVDINDIDWAAELQSFCREHGVVTVLKGAQTRVASSVQVSYGLFGGPVLSRGGSGDVLAGLLGGCLVQRPDEPYLAAQQAVCWHGLAAQQLAREQGQVSVTTMELVGHLPSVIRNQSI